VWWAGGRARDATPRIARLAAAVGGTIEHEQIEILSEVGERDGGHGTFTASSALTPVGGSIALCDFDGMNGPDLAISTYDSATTAEVVNVLLNTGGGFATPITYPSGGSSPAALVCGDLDVNGSADLAINLVANNRFLYSGGGVYPSSTVSIYLNNGSGSFAEPALISVGTQPAGVLLRDFDNDGRLDLAVANQTTAASFLRGAP